MQQQNRYFQSPYIPVKKAFNDLQITKMKNKAAKVEISILSN